MLKLAQPVRLAPVVSNPRSLVSQKLLFGSSVTIYALAVDSPAMANSSAGAL
ncbi:MAG: hypothetical protein HKN81_07920 [Gammaproteobacteria bacterium]|nr:hypothetical protein [Gammaproteobacteria bacterium]